MGENTIGLVGGPVGRYCITEPGKWMSGNIKCHPLCLPFASANFFFLSSFFPPSLSALHFSFRVGKDVCLMTETSWWRGKCSLNIWLNDKKSIQSSVKQPGVFKMKKKSGVFEFQPAQNSTTHWEIFIATTGERGPPHCEVLLWQNKTQHVFYMTAQQETGEWVLFYSDRLCDLSQGGININKSVFLREKHDMTLFCCLCIVRFQLCIMAFWYSIQYFCSILFIFIDHIRPSFELHYKQTHAIFLHCSPSFYF